MCGWENGWWDSEKMTDWSVGGAGGGRGGGSWCARRLGHLGLIRNGSIFAMCPIRVHEISAIIMFNVKISISVCYIALVKMCIFET